MTKKIICVCFLILCCSMIFAGASNETYTAGKTSNKTNNGVNALGPINRLIAEIGDVFSSVTSGVMLGLHPFPNILRQFYTVAGGQLKDDEEALTKYDLSQSLTSSSFYQYKWDTAKNKSGETYVKLGGDTKSGFYISEKDYTANSQQKIRWSIVSYLFVVFFAAEIIFTAIFGYIAPQDENASLFRQIGVSAAMTLMLFLLCASLPFLLEAVRYGLFTIAKEFVGQDDNLPETMFSLPSKFMTDMAVLMQDVFWGNDIQNIMDGSDDTKSVGVLGRLLAGVMFILFEFILSTTIIKAGLHIVVNLIEVYILLSVVMLTLPMSIFTPLKSVLRKGVYSLLTNLLECFVICLMVLIVIPACQNSLQSVIALLDSFSNYSENYLELSLTAAATLKDGRTTDNITWDLTINGYDSDDDSDDKSHFIVALTWATTDEGVGEKKGYVAYKNMETKEVEEFYDSSDYYYVNWDTLEGVLAPYMYVSQGEGSINSTSYSSLEEYLKAYGEQTLKRFKTRAFMEYYKQQNGYYPESAVFYNYTTDVFKSQANELSYTQVFTGAKLNDKFAEIVLFDPNAHDEASSVTSNFIMITSLIICWLVVYLPCYFIQQSTQITNALSSGNAGAESLSNAISQDLNKIQQGGTMVANVAKFATGAVANFKSGGQTSSLIGALALQRAEKNDGES